jgi:hypothetical protein
MLDMSDATHAMPQMSAKDAGKYKMLLRHPKTYSTLLNFVTSLYGGNSIIQISN